MILQSTADFLLNFPLLCLRRRTGRTEMRKTQKIIPEYSRAGESGRLDIVDRRILAALRENGRLTMNELAAKVALSPSPCWTRVKRLEASGVIEGYVALINHKAIGLAITV